MLTNLKNLMMCVYFAECELIIVRYLSVCLSVCLSVWNLTANRSRRLIQRRPPAYLLPFCFVVRSLVMSCLSQCAAINLRRGGGGWLAVFNRTLLSFVSLCMFSLLPHLWWNKVVCVCVCVAVTLMLHCRGLTASYSALPSKPIMDSVFSSLDWCRLHEVIFNQCMYWSR